MVLPDECDFCDQVLEEDEELKPVWAGKLPEPGSERTQAAAQRQEKKIARRVDTSPREMENIEVLGYPVDELSAILQAVRKNDSIEVDTSRAVREVKAVGSQEPQALEDFSAGEAQLQPTEVGTEMTDKVGAEISVQPKREEPEPDLEVCEMCYESIFNGEA